MPAGIVIKLINEISRIVAWFYILGMDKQLNVAKGFDYATKNWEYESKTVYPSVSNVVISKLYVPLVVGLVNILFKRSSNWDFYKISNDSYLGIYMFINWPTTEQD